jgi:hypothetical protein
MFDTLIRVGLKPSISVTQNLKPKRVRALDWARHDHNVHDKVVQWFTVIGKELNDHAIATENVYNMNETGVLLSVLSSLKVLVSQDTGVKRT